jgi:hypothetical protein
MLSASVHKRDSHSWTKVSLEVRASNEFKAYWHPNATVALETLGSIEIPIQDVEITCLSAARYARSIVPLDNCHIVFHLASGVISSDELDGFSVATLLACVIALGCNNLIDTLDHGHWEHDNLIG